MDNSFNIETADMKKILVIGASTSSTSINKKLAVYAATLVDAKATTLDLNEFEMPIYSVDREQDGFPKFAHDFAKLIKDHDGVLISLAEHNGTYTAAFKNILDWSSRTEAGKLWQNKPMLILSTSPGGRGGATVSGLANNHWPFMAAEIKGSFSLPFFDKNFVDGEIVDADRKSQLVLEVEAFQKAL